MTDRASDETRRERLRRLMPTRVTQNRYHWTERYDYDAEGEIVVIGKDGSERRLTDDVVARLNRLAVQAEHGSVADGAEHNLRSLVAMLMYAVPAGPDREACQAQIDRHWAKRGHDLTLLRHYAAKRILGWEEVPDYERTARLREAVQGFWGREPT